MMPLNLQSQFNKNLVWDCYATPQVKVMQFLFVDSFALNSRFKAVLAASPVFFAVHFR
jgi:hypothetical protein